MELVLHLKRSTLKISLLQLDNLHHKVCVNVTFWVDMLVSDTQKSTSYLIQILRRDRFIFNQLMLIVRCSQVTQSYSEFTHLKLLSRFNYLKVS